MFCVMLRSKYTMPLEGGGGGGVGLGEGGGEEAGTGAGGGGARTVCRYSVSRIGRVVCLFVPVWRSR